MIKIPLKLIELQGDGFHILIEANLFGVKQNMVVDTGASKTVLDKQTLLDTGIMEEELINSDVLSSGLGTTNMQSFTISIPNLELGEWTANNIVTAVLDLSTINYAYSQMGFDPVIGVIGGDILHRYGALINYKTMTMQLNKRVKSNQFKLKLK